MSADIAVGQSVRLGEALGAFGNVPAPGTVGTVQAVIGRMVGRRQIVVAWSDGGSLTLVEGVDDFEVIA